MTEPTDRNALFRATYIKGMLIFGYGLAWLLLPPLLLGTLTGSLVGGAVANLIGAALGAALLGSVGGATALLNQLNLHAASRQDFHQQSLFTYLLPPLRGLGAGLLALIVVSAPAHLLINLATTGQLLAATTFATPTFLAVTLLLAWTAGFYQQQAFQQVKALFQRTPGASPPPPQPGDPEPMAYKEWYQWQLHMIRWSYTWGLGVLGYGLLWLIALVAILAANLDRLLAPPEINGIAALMQGALPAVIAGGVGGVVGLLNDLYRHVSVEQDFDRQYLMAYLVQPPVGGVFGGAMYLFVGSGYVAFYALFSPDPLASVPGTPATIVMAQMVLGWVAGYRQRLVHDLVIRLLSDVFAFVKTALKLLKPSVLFNQEQRTAVLKELAQRTEIFRPARAATAAPEEAPASLGWVSKPPKG